MIREDLRAPLVVDTDAVGPDAPHTFSRTRFLTTANKGFVGTGGGACLVTPDFLADLKVFYLTKCLLLKQ